MVVVVLELLGPGGAPETIVVVVEEVGAALLGRSSHATPSPSSSRLSRLPSPASKKVCASSWDAKVSQETEARCADAACGVNVVTKAISVDRMSACRDLE